MRLALRILWLALALALMGLALAGDALDLRALSHLAVVGASGLPLVDSLAQQARG